MSTTTTKAIVGLQKQNNGIYSSLLNKNIAFERIVIPPNVLALALEEEHLKLLQEENIMLKEVINANKILEPKPPKTTNPPIPPPNQSKSKSKSESKPQDNIDKNDKNDDDEEEKFNNPVKNYNIICNMEELKRSFFNKDYTLFEEQVKNNPFKLYKVGYKYDNDKDNAPDFSARNLLKGFVTNFDDYRKYFMICFRCWKNQHNPTYKYNSLWIVNTNEPILNVIGSLYEDFNFVEITDVNETLEFIQQIKKLPELDLEEPVYVDEYTCIGESYVH